jgi:glycosyltransferase involved in cell wall biosynthesis
MNICVVSFIVSKAFDTPLSNLLKILNKATNQIYLVTGNVAGYNIKIVSNKIKKQETPIKKGKNPLLNLIQYIILQFRIGYKVAKLSKKIDCYIFFMEGVGLIPIVVSRIFRKKIIWMIPSSILLKSAEKNQRFLHLLFNSTQKFSAMLSHRIIVYSPNLIDEWNLNQFKRKIRIANEHFINTDKFKQKIDFKKRENTVGHIGRLSKEKGSMNFAKAIPDVLQKDKKINFVIGGDGDLKTDIKKYLNKEKVNGQAKMIGWIKKENLPDQLNKLKLIVITSYTEGLPNIMLESMACGTPVLATPVGSIPDLIKHNITGFIIKENTPEGIQKEIINAMNHPDLNKISNNAKKEVLEKFKMDITIEKFKKILKELINQ